MPEAAVGRNQMFSVTTKGTKEHENQTTEYTEYTENASPPGRLQLEDGID